MIDKITTPNKCYVCLAIELFLFCYNRASLLPLRFWQHSQAQLSSEATALAIVEVAPPTGWVTLAMALVMASAMDLAMDSDIAAMVSATVVMVLATATGLDTAMDSSIRRKKIYKVEEHGCLRPFYTPQR